MPIWRGREQRPVRLLLCFQFCPGHGRSGPETHAWPSLCLRQVINLVKLIMSSQLLWTVEYEILRTLVTVIIIRAVMPISLKVYAYAWEALASIKYHGFLVPIIRLFLSSAPKRSSKHLLGNDFPRNLVVKRWYLGITLEGFPGFRKILIQGVQLEASKVYLLYVFCF